MLAASGAAPWRFSLSICTTRLQFFGHIVRADASMDHSRALRSSVAPLPRDWKHKLSFAQLNMMSVHLTLLWQLPITEHKIARHGRRSWEQQRDDDDDDDDDDDKDGDAWPRRVIQLPPAQHCHCPWPTVTIHPVVDRRPHLDGILHTKMVFP